MQQKVTICLSEICTDMLHDTFRLDRARNVKACALQFPVVGILSSFGRRNYNVARFQSPQHFQYNQGLVHPFSDGDKVVQGINFFAIDAGKQLVGIRFNLFPPDTRASVGTRATLCAQLNQLMILDIVVKNHLIVSSCVECLRGPAR